MNRYPRLVPLSSFCERKKDPAPYGNTGGDKNGVHRGVRRFATGGRFLPSDSYPAPIFSPGCLHAGR